MAALDAVAPLALEQPPGAPKPAAGTANLPVAGEGHPDPERAAEGRELLARVQGGAMRALEQLAVLGLAADHVCAGGEERKVVRSKRGFPVGPRERLVGLRPSL